MGTRLTGHRHVHPSAAELLAGATCREPLRREDGKSGVPMERVVIDGRSYVTKQLSHRLDWVARASGDYGCRVLACWRLGILDRLPDCLDHTIVAVAYDAATRTTTLLMDDVAEHLLPEGSTHIPLQQHHRLLDHMARLHATFHDRGHALPVLTPMTNRYSALTPLTTEVEQALGGPSPVPAMFAVGWAELDRAVPDAARLARAYAADPWPLVEAMSRTPSTFVHGDWKAGNIGSRPDGRTILLDWQWPGSAPGCLDLTWYLAINADRLPEAKEASIAVYRDALGRHGVDTDGWFDTQLSLCLLGTFVQLGWNKTHDLTELRWWADRASAAAELVT